jgi:microcystin-dependent protein
MSHIGMVIHSTTLDTEAKVKAIYGGSKWIQLSGYVLRGATSGVTANSATKTGGEDTHTLTINEIPSHNHNTSIITSNVFTANPGNIFYGGSVYNTTGQLSGNRGGGQAHNNIPNYKSVYIWERTA